MRRGLGVVVVGVVGVVGEAVGFDAVFVAFVVLGMVDWVIGFW
jgi:hypothetical protein